MNSLLSSLLIEASSSPLDISKENYLDMLYGPKRAVIIDHPNPIADISLRLYGRTLPEGTLAYGTIPIKTEGVDFNQLTLEVARANFDWSYASAIFDTQEGLENIVQDIYEKTLPAISALSIGDRMLQVMFRLDADSEKKWTDETRKLRAEFGAVKVIPDPLMWASVAFLPSQSGDVRLLYFNHGLIS